MVYHGHSKKRLSLMFNLLVTQKEVNVAPSLSRIGSDSSKTPPGIANLDDVLDDLLEETSNVMNQNGFTRSLKEKAVPHCSIFFLSL